MDIFLQPLVSELLDIHEHGFELNDSYLQQTYRTRWYLATCSADGPARAVLGRFMGVKSPRSDFRSLFEGSTFENAGTGTYFTGYAKPVEQTFFPGEKLDAWDKRLALNHKTSMDLATRVERKELEPNKAGRHGITLLAKLPAFDTHYGFLIPAAHLIINGLLKGFWYYVLMDYTGACPRNVLPNRARNELTKRGKRLQLPHDMGRPYVDIVKKKGTWVMENWLHWAETFCQISHPLLEEHCPDSHQAWLHLRAAVRHYLCSFDEYDNLSKDEVDQKRLEARDHVREYAKIVETKLTVQLCTMNLRLAQHLHDQEEYTGWIKDSMEFWVEREVQREKKHVKDRVVIMPETFLGNMHLLECAVQNIENDVGDMMMLPQQPGTISDHHLRDDFTSVTRLLDKGEERKITDDFKIRLGHLRALVKQFGSKHSLDEFTLLRFKSASLGGKEFTSKAYSRHQSRCSYHVCFRTTDAPSEDKYGDVVHYYLLHHRVSNERIRFCELQWFKGSGVQHVHKTPEETLLVLPLECIRRKVIFYPLESDHIEILPCPSKGRL